MVIMKNTNIDGSRFYESRLAGAYFRGAKMSNMRIDKSDLSECSFVETDWEFTEVYDSNLSESDFAYSKMQNAKFDRCELYKSDFGKCDLSGVSFVKSVAFKCNFIKAKLVNANFLGADLAESDFTGADLAGANFMNANLNNAKGVVKIEMDDFYAIAYFKDELMVSGLSWTFPVEEAKKDSYWRIAHWAEMAEKLWEEKQW